MACADCFECPFETNRPNMNEIHISVPKEEETLFYKFCNEFSIKGLSVDFINTKNLLDRHVMTAEIYRGSVVEAMVRLRQISSYMVEFGLTVERSKLETSVKKTGPLSFGYFERHIRYEVGEGDKDQFLNLISGNGVKISMNSKHNGFVPLLTLKSYKEENLDDFRGRFERFENFIIDNGFVPVKTMLEQCVYDDNYAYDDVWRYE